VRSELLGSFGDNELSPECLDGAQRFLKEETGISIPVSYTSYIAPISSSKLHQEVSAHVAIVLLAATVIPDVRDWGIQVKAYNDVKHFETTYVVKMHAFKELAPAQPCWTFEHPNKEMPIDNTRESEHTFTLGRSSCLHGFAGYFDAHLYGGVHISIYPETFSTGMFSWFPLFFPIRSPMYIPKDANVKLQLWRCVADKKVI
jgi:protein arginine N-methyltransferase 5